MPTRDRSIRNIPVSPNHRPDRPRPPAPEMYEEDDRPRKRGRMPRWFWLAAIVVVVVCAIGGLLLSTLFAGASVTLYPKQADVKAPNSLTAALKPAVGALGYQIMTVTESATTTAQAHGTAHVSRSASGVVTIYNNYSTASQRLIANTRFAAQGGLVYRIHDSVVVPGQIKAANGSLTPGSISTTIYADSAGPEYNRGDTTFTIPGFKGDPRYDKFYAQSQGAISGGFVGEEPSIAPADLASAQQALKQSLDSALGRDIGGQVPEGFLPVPGTLQMTYGSTIKTNQSSDTSALSQSVTGSVAIVRLGDLAAAVAKQTVQGYAGEAVGFADLNQISLGSATSSKTAQGSIAIQLSGSPTLVWQIDEDAIKQALLGKEKSAFQTIIQTFEPAVTKADAKIRPFWHSTFPADPNKISVTVNTAK